MNKVQVEEQSLGGAEEEKKQNEATKLATENTQKDQDDATDFRFHCESINLVSGPVLADGPPSSDPALNTQHPVEPAGTV